MGRAQTVGARDRATPSAQATETVHRRWFQKVKSNAPYFFSIYWCLAWRSQLYFKCYRLLTTNPLHFHVSAKVIWGCVSPLFGIEQTKLFFSCLTPHHPQIPHTNSPPVCSHNLFCVYCKLMNLGDVCLLALSNGLRSGALVSGGCGHQRLCWCKSAFWFLLLHVFWRPWNISTIIETSCVFIDKHITWLFVFTCWIGDDFFSSNALKKRTILRI